MDSTRFNLIHSQSLHNRAGEVNKKKTEPSQLKEFEKVLSNELNITDSATINPQRSALSEIDAVYPASFINDDPADISDRINSTIDLLEKYAHLLSNPAETLKDIHPILMDINTRVKTIAKELNTESHTDNTDRNNELKKVTDQILSMVQIERFKMERGDYTDR